MPQTYQSFYPPDTSSLGNRVMVQVRVPSPDAEVWFEGAKTNQRGMDRTFESPELTPGYKYTYHMRARWTDNGQPRDQTREVRVQPGQSVTVDFTRPQENPK
jgi:uncharacterized protein (TIGR03000 family)